MLALHKKAWNIDIENCIMIVCKRWLINFDPAVSVTAQRCACFIYYLLFTPTVKLRNNNHQTRERELEKQKEVVRFNTWFGSLPWNNLICVCGRPLNITFSQKLILWRFSWLVNDLMYQREVTYMCRANIMAMYI